MVRSRVNRTKLCSVRRAFLIRENGGELAFSRMSRIYEHRTLKNGIGNWLRRGKNFNAVHQLCAL
jgi:hypothetical protein